MKVELVIEAKAALDALAAADIAASDRAALDGMLVHLGRVRGVVAGFDVEIARRSRQLAAEGRSECAEDVMAEHGRRAGRDARAVAAREKACQAMPVFEEAMTAGAVSSGHVDALAAAAHGLDETAMAEFAGQATTLRQHAESHSVEDFARQCRELARAVSGDDGESRLAGQRRQRRVRRWVDQITGMHHLHAQLDPEAAARVDAALDAATRARRSEEHRAEGKPDESPTWDQDCADALVELITGARSVDRRVPDIAVHIDWATLLHGAHEHSLCETSDGTTLPVSTVRRLCCDAEIFPVVLGADGAVLDAGRSQRLAHREQRRALRAMYRTCGHPHCTTPFDRCEIHHVQWWEHFGPTDLANLLPLCGFHHHLVHEGGWTLTIKPDRTLTVRRPDGTITFEGSTINRTPADTTTEPVERAGHPRGRPPPP